MARELAVFIGHQQRHFGKAEKAFYKTILVERKRRLLDGRLAVMDGDGARAGDSAQGGVPLNGWDMTHGHQDPCVFCDRL